MTAATVAQAPVPHYIRNIPESTWQKLRRRADSLGMTVGRYIALLVEEDGIG